MRISGQLSRFQKNRGGCDIINPMEKERADYFLLGVVGTIILLGVLVFSGVSAPLALENFCSTSSYLFHQLLFGFLPGIILGVTVFLLPVKLMKKLALPLFLLTILSLLFVFHPIAGVISGGAARWLTVGPISFQPSEFLKLTFILYIAAWLAGRHKEQVSARGSLRRAPSADTSSLSRFIVFLAITVFLSALLISQPDMSTLGIIVATGTIMYFVARVPIRYLIVLGALSVPALFLLVKYEPYRFKRIMVFLNPSIEPMGIGYQLKQALITIGSGGLIGIGAGMNSKQLQFLPAVMSDAIFAAFAQELGFVGSFLLIALFVLFAWRGISIAKNSGDVFYQLVAVGITSWITLQAFVNMGAMSGILPIAGVPLPFLSYGGSHVIAELIGVGILLNISRRSGARIS